MVNYVITGANKAKGIGLSLVKELAKDLNNKIFATARDPSKAPELTSFAKEHSNVEVVQLTDVSSEEATENAVETVESKLGADEGIDVLISNTAYFVTGQVLNTDPNDLLDSYRINTIGSIITFQKFYPLLKKSNTRKVLFTSSSAASLTDHHTFTNSAYGSSKAALNHLIRDLNAELGEDGFKFIAYHPGFVATDMGLLAIDKLFNGDVEGARKNFGLIEPEESAVGIKTNLIEGIDNGKIDTDHMWNWDGSEAGW